MDNDTTRPCKDCDGKGHTTLEERRAKDEERRRHISCADCKRLSSVNFVVYDVVWRKAVGRDVDLVLCLRCTEVRLERRLTIHDFDLTIPINYAVGFGFAMASEEPFEVPRGPRSSRTGSLPHAKVL